MAAKGTEGPHSYSGILRHAANQLSEEVLGRKLVDYTAPRKYTGMYEVKLVFLIDFMQVHIPVSHL